MEIDVEIERISNGFIVTGKDSSNSKEYFPTLEKYLEARLMEQVKEIDKYHREHNTDGETQILKFSLEEI